MSQPAKRRQVSTYSNIATKDDSTIDIIESPRNANNVAVDAETRRAELEIERLKLEVRRAEIEANASLRGRNANASNGSEGTDTSRRTGIATAVVEPLKETQR